MKRNVKFKPVNKWIAITAAFIGVLVGLVFGLIGSGFGADLLAVSLLTGLATGLICAQLLKWMFFSEQLITTTSQMFSMGPFQGQIRIGGQQPSVKKLHVPHEHVHHHHKHAKPSKEKKPSEEKKKKNDPEYDVSID